MIYKIEKSKDKDLVAMIAVDKYTVYKRKDTLWSKIFGCWYYVIHYRTYKEASDCINLCRQVDFDNASYKTEETIF